MGGSSLSNSMDGSSLTMAFKVAPKHAALQLPPKYNTVVLRYFR